jgi:putative flippase GtrA
VAGQAISYAHSSGERRQQLKWLLAGAVAGAAGLGLGLLLSGAGLPGPVRSILTATGLLALPVSMAVAVFKYRLLDIDRILSRTLAYAIVTGLLVGVYAGLVLLATRVLTVHAPVAVAGSVEPAHLSVWIAGAGR